MDTQDGEWAWIQIEVRVGWDKIRFLLDLLSLLWALLRHALDVLYHVRVRRSPLLDRHRHRLSHVLFLSPKKDAK